MSEGDLDKSEEATPFRLEEARRRGEVAKSAELTGVAVLAGFAIAMSLTAEWLAVAVSTATRQVIELAGSGPLFTNDLGDWLLMALAPIGQALVPVVMTIMIAAVITNLLQTGPILTAHPLKPDLKRMNPSQALSRVMSLRSLWELGKMVLKLSLMTAGCWIVAGKLDGFVLSTMWAPPSQLGPSLKSTFVWTSTFVLLVLVVVALADFYFVRSEFARKMRMSRREVTDEHKRREGSPEVRARRRKLVRELLNRMKATGKVGDADVVITNPTHIAVALRYRPKEMRAPVVVAKGAGFLARRIRSQAQRHGVAQTRIPVLARALFRQCDIDEPVPEALFKELAPVYRWLMTQPGQKVFS